jgi:hypothetical protein
MMSTSTPEVDDHSPASELRLPEPGQDGQPETAKAWFDDAEEHEIGPRYERLLRDVEQCADEMALEVVRTHARSVHEEIHQQFVSYLPPLHIMLSRRLDLGDATDLAQAIASRVPDEFPHTLATMLYLWDPIGPCRIFVVRDAGLSRLMPA